MKLTTDVELAEILGLADAAEVHRLCREQNWPCVRPKRSIWRFTDSQVEQIVLMLTKKAKRSTGNVAQAAGRLPGQTARSARRSA